MKEKRDIRKELRLTPAEMAAFQTAADAAGLPLATWIVQAARERLAQHTDTISGGMTTKEMFERFYNLPEGEK